MTCNMTLQESSQESRRNMSSLGSGARVSPVGLQLQPQAAGAGEANGRDCPESTAIAEPSWQRPLACLDDHEANVFETRPGRAFGIVLQCFDGPILSMIWDEITDYESLAVGAAKSFWSLRSSTSLLDCVVANTVLQHFQDSQTSYLSAHCLAWFTHRLKQSNQH